MGASLVMPLTGVVYDRYLCILLLRSIIAYSVFSHQNTAENPAFPLRFSAAFLFLAYTLISVPSLKVTRIFSLL